MRSLSLVTALISGALITASATGRDRWAVPDAVPDGKAVPCVPIRNIQDTRVHGDRTIDFHMLGGKVYRNILPYSCATLGFEERFSYITSQSQLCAVDIITVLRAPDLGPGPSCGLGEFQPVKLTPARPRQSIAPEI
jgi:hypothetical protein